jgi:hypothetical protein
MYNEHQAAERLGLKSSTLKQYRYKHKSPDYFKLNTGEIAYLEPCLQRWEYYERHPLGDGICLSKNITLDELFETWKRIVS